MPVVLPSAAERWVAAVIYQEGRGQTAGHRRNSTTNHNVGARRRHIGSSLPAFKEWNVDWKEPTYNRHPTRRGKPKLTAFVAVAARRAAKKRGKLLL
jgi:hypothetical protein